MLKILLVEDEKETAAMISRFLTRRGNIVDVAHTLEEGTKKASPSYELVILDIVLGDTKSFPLLEKIKKESPGTEVIMVSAYDNDEHIREAKRLGADGFLTKPFMNEYLEQVLLTKLHAVEKKKNQ